LTAEACTPPVAVCNVGAVVNAVGLVNAGVGVNVVAAAAALGAVWAAVYSDVALWTTKSFLAAAVVNAAGFGAGTSGFVSNSL
jgi:hypothetical protein